MTEADIENFKNPLKEAEKIQEVLKLLGYEVQGFRRKRKNDFYCVVDLHFVGTSFFTGDNSSIPVCPSLLSSKKGE